MYSDVEELMKKIDANKIEIEPWERGIFNDTCTEPETEPDLSNPKEFRETLKEMDWSGLDPFLKGKKKCK